MTLNTELEPPGVERTELLTDFVGICIYDSCFIVMRAKKEKTKNISFMI